MCSKRECVRRCLSVCGLTNPFYLTLLTHTHIHTPSGTHTHSHTPSHPHQVREEQIKLDLTDPSIMPTTDDYKKLVTIATDRYEAVTRAHAMVVCTEWHQFTTLDYHRIYQVMEKPAFVFDGLLILDQQKLLDIGWQVEAIRKVVMATATPTINCAH